MAMTFKTNLLPHSDLEYNLGSSDKKWIINGWNLIPLEYSSGNTDSSFYIKLNATTNNLSSNLLLFGILKLEYDHVLLKPCIISFLARWNNNSNIFDKNYFTDPLFAIKNLSFLKDNDNNIYIKVEPNTNSTYQVYQIFVSRPSIKTLLAISTSTTSPNGINGEVLCNRRTIDLSNITSTSDILAIEALTGTSGFLKKTAANTWSLDTSTYVTSSGVTSVLILATSPVVSSVSTSQTATLNTTISLADNYGDKKNPYSTKNRNLVLASGADTDGVSPSFRALVAADLPDMYWANVKINNSSSTNTTPIFGSITLNDTTLTKGVNLLTLNNNEVSYYTFRTESFGPTNNKSGLIDLGSSQYKWRNLYLNGRTNYDLTNEVLTTAGLLIHPFSVQFKNLDGTKTHTTYPISVIVSSNTDNTYNSGVRLGSVNGTTILTSGESGASFASTLEIYDDEKIYLVSDSDILLYKNVANNSSSYNGPWILGGFTTTPVNAQILIADGTVGGFKVSGYTIKTSVPENALFTDEKVKQNATTTTNNVNYKMLFTENITNGAAAQAYYNTNLIYNPSTNKLSTGNLDLSGTLNVTGVTTLSDNVTVGGSLTTNSLTINGNSLFNNNVNFNSLPTIGNLSLLLALGLSNALHFIGIATTAITDGGIENPNISTYDFSNNKQTGDVVLYNNLEYIWTNSNKWELLGDDRSFALNSISITGTDGLTGGGNLTTDRSISHYTPSGASATTYNNNGSNRTYIKKITTDKFGHITNVTTGSETVTDTNYYPTAFSWTNGTTAGPTGLLTVEGSNNVSFGAIPTASDTYYGVTKLSSATNSTATNLAATPAAVKAAILANAYAGSILTTSAATYNTEPEVKSVKINGSTTSATSTTNVLLVFDTSLKVLNFVFA